MNPLRSPGFAQCHASTVAAVPGGWLAAFFAGTAEKDPDTAIWLARHRGGRWEEPARLFKIDAQAHWNPVLFAAPDGTVRLWFKTGVDCACWRSWLACSHDGGATWDAPAPFLSDDRLARGPVRCPPIVLADGTWLAGASEERLPDPDGHPWWPYIERSADGGRTWTAHPVRLGAGAPPDKGAIQPTLWEDAAGAHCLLRTAMGRIWRSDSGDGGRSWCAAYPTDLPNNNAGVAVAALPGGRLALAWNPVEQDWGPRTPLRLSFSDDGGRTWPRHRDLAAGPGEFSYPALAVADGRLLATWTDRRQGIGWWLGDAGAA